MKLLSFGYLCLLIGFTIIIYLRYLGINLTEGQLLKEYVEWWLLAGTSCIIGLITITIEKR